MPEVVTIGESLLRLTAPLGESLEQADVLRFDVAGAESNVAIGVSRLGRSAGWISRVVDDPLGRRIVNKTREHGVDVSRVVWTDEGRVGLYYLEVGRSPRPYRIVYDRKDSAFARIDPEEVDWDYVRQARVLHLTGITPALGPNCEKLTARAIAEAKEAGLRVSFDLNYRAKLWSPDRAREVLVPLLRQADLVFCTIGEAQQVLGLDGEPETLLRRTAEVIGQALLVLTLDDGGALAWLGGEVLREHGYPLEPVDRVGAGDAFVAGFLYGLLTVGPEAGLRYAAAYAGLKHTFRGDIGWCTREDLEELIERRPPSWR